MRSADDCRALAASSAPSVVAAGVGCSVWLGLQLLNTMKTSHELARQLLVAVEVDEPEGYYMITGYNAKGRAFVGMPVLAFRDTVNKDALKLLHDNGHTACVKARVHKMRTKP